MNIQCGLLSKKGGRAVNQDYADYQFTSQMGCWTMADGLGGHGAGETAAEVAVRSVIDEFMKGICDLTMLVSNAQQAVQQVQQEKPEYRHMRTTLAVLLYKGEQAMWSHVGDSRIYHFREGHLQSQTKDHSVCQALVNAGEISFEQIRGHEDRNRLFRVLGSEGTVKASRLQQPLQLQNGDVFLLCTDGFWEFVTETDMGETLQRSSHPEQWLDEMERRLEQRAAPDHDNYSALAVWIEK